MYIIKFYSKLIIAIFTLYSLWRRQGLQTNAICLMWPICDKPVSFQRPMFIFSVNGFHSGVCHYQLTADWCFKRTTSLVKSVSLIKIKYLYFERLIAAALVVNAFIWYYRGTQQVAQESTSQSIWNFLFNILESKSIEYYYLKVRSGYDKFL